MVPSMNTFFFKVAIYGKLSNQRPCCVAIRNRFAEENRRNTQSLNKWSSGRIIADYGHFFIKKKKKWDPALFFRSNVIADFHLFFFVEKTVKISMEKQATTAVFISPFCEGVNCLKFVNATMQVVRENDAVNHQMIWPQTKCQENGNVYQVESPVSDIFGW